MIILIGSISILYLLLRLLGSYVRKGVSRHTHAYNIYIHFFMNMNVLSYECEYYFL